MSNTQAPHPGTRDHGRDGQSKAPILEVRDLAVEFAVDDGKIKVLDGVSFKVAPGQTLGVVGESGCGKSVTSLAIMGLLPKPHGQVVAGSIRFQGEELLSLAPDQMYKVRGNRISMIFQEPMTSLNPVFTVGDQISEALMTHQAMSKDTALQRTIQLLKQVNIPEAEKRVRAFPHEMSGGMRQRVMIAMALACAPALLIADEATTALDVTIQAQILDLLVRLRDEKDMGLVLITHDMGVVAETAERVVVQYAGQQVELAETVALFEDPHHPYTAALLAALPERAVEKRLPSIPGMVPGQWDRPAGCLFSPRCTFATDHCRRVKPLPQSAELGRALCHTPLVGGRPLAGLETSGASR